MSILESEHIKKSTVWLLLIAYSLMAPSGMLISASFSNFLPDYLFTRVLAFVAGIFLYVSTTILFENSENHHFSGRKLIAILAGVSLALIIRLVVH
jgi:zinc transporter ZupT